MGHIWEAADSADVKGRKCFVMYVYSVYAF